MARLWGLVLSCCVTTTISLAMRGGRMLRASVDATALRQRFRLMATSSTGPVFQRRLLSEEDINGLGKQLGRVLRTGDVVLLTGDLGAGKTTFSRGVIRTKCEDDEMHVTSPTYLLDNSYEYDEENKVELIHHIDLYRLPNDCSVDFLSIPAIYSTSLCLIEWSERLRKDFIPKEFINVDLRVVSEAGGQHRDVKVSCVGPKWASRVGAIAAACEAPL